MKFENQLCSKMNLQRVKSSAKNFKEVRMSLNQEKQKKDTKARNDFWSIEGDFIYRHHVQPRVPLCVSKEESFPMPLKYIYVTRTTHTNLDVMQSKRINDSWNVDRDRNLSESWKGFTKFKLLNEKQPPGYMCSKRTTCEDPSNYQTFCLWSKAAKKQEKQEWVLEKPKLHNARKLRGIYFIDQENGENEETIQNARKKMETPLEAAMPCKMETRKRFKKLRQTAASGNTHRHKKTTYACIVEAHESERKRLESTLPRNNDDHIAKKGFNSLTHCGLVHKFIPMPQAMNIPDATPAVDKEWEKLEKILAWQMDEMKSKKYVILGAQQEKNKVHFAT